METKFIPIDYDYFDFKGRNYARIIGRNETGKQICIIDECPVYLWAILKPKISQIKTPKHLLQNSNFLEYADRSAKKGTLSSVEKITKKILKIQLDVKGRKTKVEKVELHEKNFLGQKVQALKVFATNYKDMHDIASHIDFPEIDKRRGYDLGYISHYIIEKELVPLNWYKIEGELLNNSEEFGGIDMALDVDMCIKVNTIKKIREKDIKKTFTPKTLAFDIETDEIGIGEGEILMVSLVSDNFKKVITWKTSDFARKNSEGKNKNSERGQEPSEHKSNEVEYVEDEAELIEKFIEYVKKISPDFLVGYYSDGFDLPYIKARAQKFNIKLNLGLDDSQPRFSRTGGGRDLKCKIKGIPHIDLLKFIRTAYSQYMQSETLSLNEVSKEFLGDTKKDFEFKHSSKIKENEWEKYYEYNLHDSLLTFQLFNKFWPDILEFSRVIQEPPFDVSRKGMSSNVEDYILHNLKRFNEIPERKAGYKEIQERREREKYEGAFVFEPIPNLYENIAMFDFTSFWPSIIVTFNLSKSTLLEKKEKDSVEAEVLGKKVYFTKKTGFFPELLKEIIEKRKQYKKELFEKPDVLKKARSNAFKLLANASYGYMGFFGARYYCPEASGAATAISRDFIKNTIKGIDKEGYKTIYSDTDSIAFLINEKTKKEVKETLKQINSKLPGIMELELEGFFEKGLWVTTRAGTTGAKKKYALIDKEDKIKIRGFETVRRDWCKLARKTQNKIIQLVLKDGNEKKALIYIKEIVKKIKNREIKLKELMIKTQLKKPLSEYKAQGPHVIAAKKMKEQEIPVSQGNLIEYYIAETGGKKVKLVRDKVKLPTEKGEYEIEYYLNKQILPAVENIFQVLDVNIKEILEGKKQMTLGDF
ncbi:hypothetical protein HN832_00275 [archaeon]|mgnify:CR=1 FL=1|jgi:DNA polymerase, archaea type|nr:hypothetical protein [archaeon]MBT4373679.1 hypothetical protein [archaeon]MBT4531733.1 hypothetical protein [archaeon]MBT7001845.1 hypothetical protein [archaeon]MBT7281830.1 hypothetical protein [archaeon]